MTVANVTKKKNNTVKMKKIEQIGSNAVKITFDNEIDGGKMCEAKNYWVQSMSDITAEGIASMSKDDTVNESNCLTNGKVSISVGEDKKSVILRFTAAIVKDTKYKVYVRCNDDNEFRSENAENYIFFAGK